MYIEKGLEFNFILPPSPPSHGGNTAEMERGGEKRDEGRLGREEYKPPGGRKEAWEHVPPKCCMKSALMTQTPAPKYSISSTRTKLSAQGSGQCSWTLGQGGPQISGLTEHQGILWPQASFCETILQISTYVPYNHWSVCHWSILYKENQILFVFSFFNSM